MLLDCRPFLEGLGSSPLKTRPLQSVIWWYCWLCLLRPFRASVPPYLPTLWGTQTSEMGPKLLAPGGLEFLPLNRTLTRCCGPAVLQIGLIVPIS